MPVRNLLFKRWLPDRSDYDTEASRRIRGVLPIAGSYRAFPKLTDLGGPLSVSGSVLEQAIIGAYVHVYQPTAPFQRIKPLLQVTNDGWSLEDRSTVDAGDEQSQEEVEAERIGGDFFDDGTYLVSPGAASADTFAVEVNTSQEPPASSQFLLVRYKVFNAGAGDSFTLQVRVRGDGGTLVDYSIVGTGAADPDDLVWVTDIHTLSGGEMAAFTGTDYTVDGQMEIDLIATIDGSNQVLDPDDDVAQGGWLDENAENDNPDLFSKLTDASDSTFIDSTLLTAGGSDYAEFAIEDATAPATLPENLAAIVRWKAANSGVKGDLALFSAGIRVALAENTAIPTSYSTDTVTLVVEDDVEFEDVDWEDLQFGVTAYYPIDLATETLATYLPAADVDTGDWTTAPLFSKINDASDVTFIQSPSMTQSDDESFTVDLDQDPDVAADLSRERAVKVNVRHDSASAENILLQIIEDDEVVAAKILSVASGASFLTKTWQIDNIEHPESDIGNTGWSTAPLFSKINTDASTITSSGSAGDNFTIGVTSPEDPEQDTGYLARIVAWVSSGGTGANLQVTLLEDGTVREVAELVSITDEEDVYLVPFSESAIENIDDSADIQIKVNVIEAGPVVTIKRMTFEAPTAFPDITDYSGLRLKVIARGSARTGWQMDISQVHLETAAARRATIAELDLQTDSINYLGVSWAQLQVPEPSSDSYVGETDKQAIYAARLRRLYFVDPQDTGGTVFTDISLGAADYDASSRSWDFCSWGDKLLGTNWEDEIQVHDPNAGGAAANFLTASTDTPKFRFVDMVRNSLVGCDVNFAGTPVGTPYMVAWSDTDDAEEFDLSGSDTGSGSQNLRQTPGQITGFWGGEFGLVWKRSSMIQMSWIGSPLWWRFDVVSDEIGTVHPDAICKKGATFYFLGSDGRFYETTGSEEPIPIDDGLHYEITNPQGAELILKRVASNFPHELQNRVVGAYDRGSQCCVWACRSLGDNPFENTLILIYNTIEKRWSQELIDYDGFGLSALFQTPNLEHDAFYRMYGVAAMAYDATVSEAKMVQFSGADSAVLLETPIYPIDPEDAVGYVTSVRPLFRSRFADALARRNHETTITLTVWDDASSGRGNLTQTLEMSKADRNGWIEVTSLKGRFIQGKMEIEAARRHRQWDRELIGIQVNVETFER